LGGGGGGGGGRGREEEGEEKEAAIGTRYSRESKDKEGGTYEK
jgi:hypothetical protein